MAFVTIKHSEIAYKMIMHEVMLFKRILNIIVQAVFFCYYIYLICTHLDSIGHLICYSLLLAILIASAIIEFAMKGKEDDSKNKKKKRKHDKEIIKLILKIVKYAANMGTIALAIIDIAMNGGSDLALIMVAMSSLLLSIQIIADIVIHFLKKYFTLMYLAVKMDIDQSEGVQYVTGLYKKMKGDYDSVPAEEPYLTESEKKTIELLKEQAGDNELPVEPEKPTSKKKKGMFATLAEKAIIKAGQKALNKDK